MAETRVFISYAHTRADTPVAKCAAAALRSVGIDVWLDEATLSGGDMLQSAIEQAIAASHHGIFIVSPSWLNREWTMFELEQFARRDPAVVRRIPVFRTPRRELVVPPALVRVTGFHWLEDDQDSDARLWELYCAVTDTAPGPSESWAQQWRALPKKGPAPTRPLVKAPPARVRPSLKCDRATQWTAIDELALERASQLILLPGSAGQAHDHFVERIERLLRLDPPRSMITLDWATRPKSQGEFLEALCQAFDVPPSASTADMTAGIAAALGERLAFNNLLLLHPCIRARFVDEGLVRYYTQWLPEVIERAHGEFCVKCVQPIEYPRESSGGSLLSWLRLKSGPAAETKADAEHLITTMKSASRPLLRAIRLRDLADLTQADLVEFCEFSGLTETQRTWLLAQVASRNATTPKDIFQALDDFLPDARSIA